MPTNLPFQTTLLTLLERQMPHRHARQSLHALLALMLDVSKKKRLRFAPAKSRSSLSRFLTHADWDVEAGWRALNLAVLADVYRRYARVRGGRPQVMVCLDLTVVEKVGERMPLARWVTTSKGKEFGVPFVLLVLRLGSACYPLAVRYYEGPGFEEAQPAAIEAQPVEAQAVEAQPETGAKPGSLVALALELLSAVELPEGFGVPLVLADAAFGTSDFIEGVREREMHTLVGVRRNLLLEDGRTHLHQVKARGQKVRLNCCPEVPGRLSWVWLKRSDGKEEQRFVFSTLPLDGQRMTALFSNLFSKRWCIETAFQAGKHRFGLLESGARTVQGLKRWVLLCFSALAMGWTASSPQGALSEVAGRLRETLFGDLLAGAALQEACRLFEGLGLKLHISLCKLGNPC